MSVQELKERYVYAVSRLLPHKMRGDISRELDTLIEDMLEERCQDRPAEEKDLRIILAELGSPSEMANHYSPDKDKCLIGPPYFGAYKAMMRIVFWAVAGGMLIAGGITMVMDNWQVTKAGYEYFLDIAGWLGSTFMGLMLAFAFVTLLFAFFQRKGINMEDISGNWDALPPVPVKQERISKGEAIAGICLSVAFLIIFLVVPQIICVIYKDGGQHIYVPILNTKAVRSKWFLLVGMVIFGVGRDLYGYFEGRYTKRLAVVTGAADLLSFLCLFLFLKTPGLVNPQVLPAVNSVFKADERWIGEFISGFPDVFIWVMLVILLLDFGTTLYKALKYDK